MANLPTQSDADLEADFKNLTGMPAISERMKGFLASAHPDDRTAFLAFLKSVSEPRAVDYRTKVLLRVIVCMVLDHEQGVESWGRAALKQGWSREQLVEAMFAVTPQVGFIPLIRMLPYLPPDGHVQE